MKRLKHGFWLAALPLGLLANSSFLEADEAPVKPAAPAKVEAPAVAPATPVGDAKAEAQPEDNTPISFPQGILFPYSLLDMAMQGNVDRDGHVNYVALQGHKALELFVQAVATADLTQFPVLTRQINTKDKLGRDEEKTESDRSPELVFWINAYNALVLHAILKAYPISTPDNIPDFDKVKTRRVAGQDYSFAELRKKITAMDSRAFFVLTDGTKGGPMLRSTAYRLVSLNDSLNDAVQYYISDPHNVQLLAINKKVTVNPVLKEADELFKTKAGRAQWTGIRTLLTNYSIIGSSKRYFANNTDYTIEFMRGERQLNRDPNQSPVSSR